MSLPLEKPVKDFLNKFQKDLNALQSSLKKEGDDLIKKVKKVTTKDELDARKRELEKLVEAKLKRMEPAINRFMHELNTNAKKAGVDLTKLESKVRSNLQTARSKLHKAASSVKKTGVKAGKRKATKAKRRKPASSVAGAADAGGITEQE